MDADLASLTRALRYLCVLLLHGQRPEVNDQRSDSGPSVMRYMYPNAGLTDDGTACRGLAYAGLPRFIGRNRDRRERDQKKGEHTQHGNLF